MLFMQAFSMYFGIFVLFKVGSVFGSFGLLELVSHLTLYSQHCTCMSIFPSQTGSISGSFGSLVLVSHLTLSSQYCVCLFPPLFSCQLVAFFVLGHCYNWYPWNIILLPLATSSLVIGYWPFCFPGS